MGGSVFGLRESRSAAVQGPAVPTENNVLTDGTLIDLCGATLLWRSTEGEKNAIVEIVRFSHILNLLTRAYCLYLLYIPCVISI